MTAEFIRDYAWIAWLVIILIFVIIEVLTVDLTFLMLSIGSVGGLVASAVGTPWWVQILVAGTLAVLLLFAVRPALLRALKRGGDPARSNIDALMGISGTVITDFSGTAGSVKLANGETWTARLPEVAGALPLQAGDRVVVTAIEGATAVVVPAERTAL